MDLPFITFLTAENAAQFWQYVSALLFVVMPLGIIFIATILVAKLIGVIRSAFSSNQTDEMKRYDIKIQDKKE